MGLVRLSEGEWLQPGPDLGARAAGFAEWPEGIQLTPEADAPGRELAEMLGVSGALPDAALVSHEDMCLLTKSEGEGKTAFHPTTLASETTQGQATINGSPVPRTCCSPQGCQSRPRSPCSSSSDP